MARINKEDAKKGMKIKDDFRQVMIMVDDCHYIYENPDQYQEGIFDIGDLAGHELELISQYKSTEELRKMTVKEIAQYVNKLESEMDVNSFEYQNWCTNELDNILGEKGMEFDEFYFQMRHSNKAWDDVSTEMIREILLDIFADAEPAMVEIIEEDVYFYDEPINDYLEKYSIVVNDEKPNIDEKRLRKVLKKIIKENNLF